MNLTNTRTIMQTFLASAILFTLSTASLTAGEMGGNPYQCPEEHVYLHCGELHSNYDYYGYPKAAYGYGQDVVIYGPYTEEYLDQCGRGKIIRKWKIKYHYDWYWCQQTIHISDPYGQAFDGYHDVHWPKDYDLKDCAGSMDPDHMPYGYSWPEFDHHGCSKLGIRYEDKVYPYNSYEYGDHGYGYGSHYHHPCKVVYRTWELIDWCQYTGHSSYGGHYAGRWTYVQKIYIYDEVAPEITFCPEDIEADGGDCNGSKVYVEIPKLKAHDDCGDIYYSYTREPLVDESYHSSYSSSHGVSYGGNDASGYYEPGKTKVTFKAFDICGNTTECSFVVNVVAVDNKPPTPVAISSLTAVLMMTDTNQGMVEIWPGEFNISSHDNCTSPENLIFKLEPSVFTCENYGSNEVKFIVEDEAGNSDYVIVEVIVQANAMPCMGGVINGNIVSDQGNAVPEVEVTLTDGQMKMTDDAGSFLFSDVVLGQSLKISPKKETDPMEGIDMYDYTLLSLHVDGIRKLTDPKKLIAADINGDKQIDYLDLLDMQKLVLGIDQTMPHGSWKFYKQGFEFPDTIDPLQIEIPEKIDIPENSGREMLVQVEGIKIGDLGTLIKVAEESGDLRVNNMIVNDQLLEQGEIVKVPMVLGKDAAANLFSFTLDLDPSKLEIVSIDGKALGAKGNLKSLDPSGTGASWVASWFSMEEKNFVAGETMIELTVKAKQPVTLSQSLQLTSSHVAAQSIGANGKGELKLIYQGLVQSGLTLYQNSPNPFKDETTIGFYLPETGDAVLTIRDLTGKEVLSQKHSFTKGYQEVKLTRSELPASGVLIYEVLSNGARDVKKMVLVK
ncbi:MAG: T9SS type A sorting domain-containing protein [Saprospiraceae bacterium]|nr:T9SS type A sorting domain-containing protein [Saprospiraceae bacterium]